MTHVYQEIKIHREFLPVGSHTVAEDTNINAHPVSPGFGLGAFQGVEKLLSEDVKVHQGGDVEFIDDPLLDVA
jgi:cephalosporin hydroxylase